MARAKLFCPYNARRWYVTEWDARTGECFGFVEGFETEWGYFDPTELAEATAPTLCDICTQRGCSPLRPPRARPHPGQNGRDYSFTWIGTKVFHPVRFGPWTMYSGVKKPVSDGIPDSSRVSGSKHMPSGRPRTL